MFSEDTGVGAASLRALAARLRRDGHPVRAMAPAHSGALTGAVLEALSTL